MFQDVYTHKQKLEELVHKNMMKAVEDEIDTNQSDTNPEPMLRRSSIPHKMIPTQ